MDQPDSMFSALIEVLHRPSSHKTIAATAELIALDARFHEWVYEQKNSVQTEEQLLGLLDSYEQVVLLVRAAVAGLAKSNAEVEFRNSIGRATSQLQSVMLVEAF